MENMENNKKKWKLKWFFFAIRTVLILLYIRTVLGRDIGGFLVQPCLAM